VQTAPGWSQFWPTEQGAPVGTPAGPPPVQTPPWQVMPNPHSAVAAQAAPAAR